MTKRNLLIGTWLFFGLLAMVAVGTQLVVHIQHNFSLINFFSYFTNLSNIFAAVVLIVGAVYLIQGRELTVTYDLVRGASVVAMAIVGIVFSILLTDTDLGTVLPWVNGVVHYIMPIVVVGEWLYEPPKSQLHLRQLGYWLIYPLLYLIYTLIRGAIVGFYPYPFLNPAKAGGAGGVALYCIAIFVAFLVVGWLLILLGNRLGASARASERTSAAVRGGQSAQRD